jgi:hypothetical protein
MRGMADTKAAKKKATKKSKDKAVANAKKATGGGLSLAGKLGRKSKPKSAGSKGKGKPGIDVDEKLPGHAAAVAKLEARKEELERRIGVYQKISASDNEFAGEAQRLIDEAQEELKGVEALLCKSGLLTDEYLEALGQKKDAEKRMGNAFTVLDPILEDERIKMCRSKGEYVSAMRVNEALTYVGTQEDGTEHGGP